MPDDIDTTPRLTHSVTLGGTIPLGDYINCKIEVSLQYHASEDELPDVTADMMATADTLLGQSLYEVLTSEDIESSEREAVGAHLHESINRHVLAYVKRSPYARRILLLAGHAHLYAHNNEDEDGA